MAKTTKEEEKIDTNQVTKTILSAFMDKHEKDIWNKSAKLTTQIPSGSLKIDKEISLTHGIHRFCGPAGAGKTSQAAEVARQFLLKYPKGKVLWVKAEGRLSNNIISRSGVKFVTDEKDWDYGTAFIFECNVIEVVFDALDVLIDAAYKQGERMFVVIDSVDGLRLKSDESSEYGKERTAGVPLLMKRYLQCNCHLIEASGTTIIMTSQVSAQPRKDDFGPPPLTSGAGGNASLHWANYILEFSGRAWGHHIFQDGPDTKYDKEKNPIVGHMVKLLIKKTDKENENFEILYPIKHGRADGKSIWVEQEIIEFAQPFKIIIKAGAWYTFPEEVIKDIKKEIDFEVKPKIQGYQNLVEYLEANPKLADYLYNRIQFVVQKD